MAIETMVCISGGKIRDATAKLESGARGRADPRHDQAARAQPSNGAAVPLNRTHASKWKRTGGLQLFVALTNGELWPNQESQNVGPPLHKTFAQLTLRLLLESTSRLVGPLAAVAGRALVVHVRLLEAHRGANVR